MNSKWVLLAAALLFWGCGENDNTPLAGDIASIAVEANVTSFYATQQVQMSATAAYTNDIPDRNVTGSVDWSSSDAAIADVDTQGVVSGLSSGGDVEITGSFNQFFDSRTLHVYGLTSIAIVTDGNETNLSQEQTLQLRAEGTFDDNTTLDVTEGVAWTLIGGDSNATLEQNGTLYTGDANGTLEIIVTRYDVNASRSFSVLP